MESLLDILGRAAVEREESMAMNRRWKIAYVVATLLLAVAALFERRWGSAVAMSFLSASWSFMLWKERNKD